MTDRSLKVGRGKSVCAWILTVLASAGVAAAAGTTDQLNVVASPTFDAAIITDIYRAQTFTVGRDGLLSEIGFQAYNVSPTALNPVLSVYHASTTSAATAVPESLYPRFTTSVPLSAFPTNTSSLAGAVPLTSFSLGTSAIPVKAGDVLTLGLAMSGTSSNNLHWRSGTDSYPGGRFFAKVGTGAWNTLGGTVGGQAVIYDAGFRTAIEDMTVGRFSPAVDATATKAAGGGYTVNTSDISVFVQNTGSAGSDRRGIIEYNAASVPNDADVRAATLTFELSAMSSSAGSLPSVNVYAYAGNGVAESADTAQTAILVGTSATATDIGEKMDIRLDANLLEGILSTSDHLGLLVVGTNGQQFGLWSSEAGSPARPVPSLTIAYAVPEPASAGLLAVAAAGLLVHRRRR